MPRSVRRMQHSLGSEFHGRLDLRLALLLFGFAIPFSLSGCSLGLNSGRTQCTQDSDCAVFLGELENPACRNQVCIATEALVQAEPELPEPWRCLSEPEPTRQQFSEQVELRFRTIELTDDTNTVPNVRVRVCANRDDPSCAEVLAEGTTDGQGRLDLNVPWGFAGFAEAEAEGWLPEILMINPATSNTYAPFYLATASELRLLVALTGAPYREDSIAVGTVSWDCNAANATGVKIAATPSDATTHFVYLNDTVPITGPNAATGPQGEAFALDPAIGPQDTAYVEMSASVDGVGTIDRESVIVKRGYISLTTLAPIFDAPSVRSRLVDQGNFPSWP